MRKLRLAAAATFALTATATAPAAAQNLVVNGDFSDGLNGWGGGGTQDIFGIPVGWTWDPAGYAVGTGAGDFWQTVDLTAGETYTVQFDYQQSFLGFGLETGFFTLFANYFHYNWDLPDSDVWTHFSADFVAQEVQPVYDGLQFTVQYRGGLPDKIYRIDNVSLTAASATSNVPEPATWAMMLLGFGAVGFQLRGKRKGALTVQ